jgi:aspartate-semialdehyde dehydrogenase
VSGFHLALVGATGAVGREILAVLEERRFPVASLRCLASERSAGQSLAFAGETVKVEPLGPDSFRGVDLALFSAGAALSRAHVPRANAAGAVVVDNSSAYRLDPDVPLVVPEVNPETIAGHRGILANPNCSTILLVVVLAPLDRAAGLRRVVVSTYQAASGAGQRAIQELREGSRAALDGQPHEPDALPHPLAFNLFAQVDQFQEDGYTREEDKMLHETRRILGRPDLALEATCVRVPVERCHSEAVSLELDRPLDPDRAREILAAAPGIEIRDDPAALLSPQPAHMVGRDEVAVGRLRASRVFAGGLALWLVGDQLRKGAAVNAVQIAEKL